MTPTLRKKHRFFWILAALILPLLFVAAVWQIPQPAYESELPDMGQEKAIEKATENIENPKTKQHES